MPNLKTMNTFIKHIFGAVAVMAAVHSPSFGQKVLTLDDCRDMAVEFNKELKGAALQKKEALANQEVARTAYLPSVKTEVSAMHYPSIDGISIPGYFLPTAESEAEARAGNYSGTSDVWNPGMSIDLSSLSMINTSLSISQAVYAGGKIKFSNQQADAGVEISELALNMKYAEVIENTDQAFWNVAMVESNINIATEYIKMLTELEEQMSAMYEVGLQPASEKLRVTVQKNEAELNLIKAKNGLRIAKMYLNQLMGQPLKSEIKISYTNSDVELQSLAQNIENPATVRNELKILEKQKEISELEAKKVRADYLPTVGVQAQYSSYYLDDLNENFDFQPSVAAQVSIPVFQWGQGKKKQRAAKLKVEQAELDLQHTNDLLNLEIMQAKVQLEEAFESVQLAMKNIEEAEESLDETRASFDVGLNTTTELLNAQAQWQEAKSQLVTAKAQFRIRETAWERVNGRLYKQE